MSSEALSSETLSSEAAPSVAPGLVTDEMANPPASTDPPAEARSVSEKGADTPASAEYARAVGARLRGVRQQLRLSLQAVEARSAQEFKASVLGAYERGERAISVPRLQRLAKLYRVPVDYLLPPTDIDGPPEVTEQRPREAGGPASRTPWLTTDRNRVIIDLGRLEGLDELERTLLRRFLDTIQRQRQEFGQQRISIRSDDLRAIEILFGFQARAQASPSDEQQPER